MPSNPSRQSLVGLSSTAGFPTAYCDWSIRPFNLTVAITGSSATFNVEGSLDYTGSSAFASSAAVWFSSFGSALVSTNAVAISTPLTAVRLNVTAGSSTATTTMTVLQSG